MSVSRIFEAGDMFEISGGEHMKVISVTDDYFVCCPVVQSSGLEVAMVNLSSPATYSNKGGLEDKYWIKRVDTYECTYPRAKEL